MIFTPHRSRREAWLGLALPALLALACTTKPVNPQITPDRTPTRDGGSDTPQRDPDHVDPVDGGAPGEGGKQCPPPPATLKSAGEDCDCDNECSEGFCQDGACCTGAACGERPPGAPCANADQCESGFCADGVCCNVSCTGACVSCNQSDRMGECVPVPTGMEDPHKVCRQDPPDSCGQSGTCNGQGGCAKYAPGTTCGVGTCEGPRTVLGGAECDGAGTCVKAGSLDCAPFTCEAGSCRVSCTSDAQCTAPNVCVNGSCGKRGNGQACTSADQCNSNFCVDGVCCNTACTGRCQFCASAATRGTCTPVRADAPDPRAALGNTNPAQVCLDEGPGSCGTDGRCNGQGGCQRYRDGTTCRAGRCDAAANTETGAAVCRGGECQVPAARSCAPYRGCSGSRCVSQCGSDSQCAAGTVCQDGSCGKRPNGAICSRPADCESGVCAQGRCCSTACNSPCRACNVEGSLGTCAAVPAGGTDPTGSCRDDACNNGCDGNGGCRREQVGASCRAATCTGTSLTRFTCDAQGACQMSTVPCPAGQMCAMNRCVPPAKKGLGEVCVAPGDCQSNFCVGGRCCAGACAGVCRACTAATMWACADRPNGSACGGGRVCQGGQCALKEPGAICSGGAECRSGSCVSGRCCANSCAASPCRTCTAATMWACANVPNQTPCGAGRVCREGVCAATCPVGQVQCGTACVDLRTDPNNCGACRRACPSGSCVGGTCTGACPIGQTMCPPLNRCVNLQNNRLHCGDCNVACPPLQICRMGACVPRRGGDPEPQVP